MKWTKDPPTEAGWWLWRYDGRRGFMRLACLEWHTPAIAGRTLRCRDGTVPREMKRTDTEWAGPIPEPEEAMIFDKGEPAVFVRIREGELYGQDFRYMRADADLARVVFAATGDSDGMMTLVAQGYGVLGQGGGAYGNGAIHLKAESVYPAPRPEEEA